MSHQTLDYVRYYLQRDETHWNELEGPGSARNASSSEQWRSIKMDLVGYKYAQRPPYCISQFPSSEPKALAPVKTHNQITMALLIPTSFERDLFRPSRSMARNISGWPMLGCQQKCLCQGRPRRMPQPKRPLPAEWKDCEDHFEADIAAAGFSRKDFHLGVNQALSQLLIVASHETRDQDGVVHTRSFKKFLALPEDCQGRELTLDYEEGSLKIKIPKVAPQSIAPQSGGEVSFAVIPDVVGPAQVPEVQDSESEVQDKESAVQDKESEVQDKESEVQDTESEFTVSLDVSGYKPEDLQVEVTPNGILRISGHFEEKSEGHYVRCQIQKSFTLPRNCQVDGIQTRLSQKGQLTITAPKAPSMSSEQTNRAVAISVDQNTD